MRCPYFSLTIILNTVIDEIGGGRDIKLSIRQVGQGMPDFCCRFFQIPVGFFVFSIRDHAYVDGFQLYLDLLADKKVHILISNCTAERCSASADVIVYDFNSSNPPYFIDWIHMSGDGRKVLSDEIKPLFHITGSEPQLHGLLAPPSRKNSTTLTA